MPPTYMAQAVLATLFCCVPLGVVAIVKASQVSAAWQNGDVATAHQRSREAAAWVNWSVGVTFLMGLLWMVFAVFAGMGAPV
jgi:archaellum biogenesis protein FlaJ (TadC family)